MLDNKEEDIELLAETCLWTARQIKEYLHSKGHPQMSFDQNGPAFFPQDAPLEIQLARLDLRAAAKRLYDVVSGPDEVLAYNAYNMTHDLNAFRYVNHYSIAHAVPLNDTISYTELAKKLSLDSKQLRQMMRQLIQSHVFSEPTTNNISHTVASKLLLTHPGVAAFSAFISQDVFPMAARQIEALAHFGHGSPHPNEAALNFACNTNLPMFEYYETQPEVRERFSQIMTFASSSPAMANEHVASGFDWAALPDGSTVVDVAGSVGHCSVAIARANPGVSIVVQDLPKIVESAADPATSVIPEDLRARITFQAYDFFAEQPVRGAAVYFFRMVMHSYSDEYCLSIFRAVMPSMAPESRIVIMDQVAPSVGVLPSAIERFMRTQDLQMMLLSNARERDEAEWRELAERAVEDGEPQGGKQEGVGESVGEGTPGDKGKLAGRRLEVKNIVSPQGSGMSLIEIGFVDIIDDAAAAPAVDVGDVAAAPAAAHAVDVGDVAAAPAVAPAPAAAVGVGVGDVGAAAAATAVDADVNDAAAAPAAAPAVDVDDVAAAPAAATAVGVAAAAATATTAVDVGDAAAATAADEKLNGTQVSTEASEPSEVDRHN